jgi:hypothetical protein
MNCLLAAAPSLTLRTYTLCTALSLFKVIVHTSVGASIHSFKDYHGGKQSTNADTMARTWTIVGIVLCVAIFVYLLFVARRAVDDELAEERTDDEERMAFLNPAAGDVENGQRQDMAESPLRSHDNIT